MVINSNTYSDGQNTMDDNSMVANYDTMVFNQGTMVVNETEDIGVDNIKLPENSLNCFKLLS